MGDRATIHQLTRHMCGMFTYVLHAKQILGTLDTCAARSTPHTAAQTHGVVAVRLRACEFWRSTCIPRRAR